MKKKAAKKVIKKKVVKKSVRKPVKKVAPKKKPAAKKPAAKKPAAKKPALKLEGKLVGEVTHYFSHVRAAVLKLKIPLAVGDTIKIKGHTTDFTQTVNSLQIDRTALQKAKAGDEIGLQVDSRVRKGDLVTKL